MKCWSQLVSDNQKANHQDQWPNNAMGEDLYIIGLSQQLPIKGNQTPNAIGPQGAENPQRWSFILCFVRSLQLVCSVWKKRLQSTSLLTGLNRILNWPDFYDLNPLFVDHCQSFVIIFWLTYSFLKAFCFSAKSTKNVDKKMPFVFIFSTKEECLTFWSIWKNSSCQRKENHHNFRKRKINFPNE